MVVKLNHIIGVAIGVICLTTIPNESSAQYYSWGTDRASLKWQKMEGAATDVLYPESATTVGERVMGYIDAANPYISYGFKYPAPRFPFVVHPDNFQANGMVMWMPKRVEFLSIPDVDSYSMLWLKQLVAHEYRHTVQYNNLDKSTLSWLKYLLGQQGAAIGLLIPPLYAIEGDAVLCETNMSTYGRALQPSFTMAYRALGDEVLLTKSIDKWMCGSYLQHIPDHYRMGYQMMAYANNKYGESVLGRAIEFASRKPYYIFSYDVALSKFYDTSAPQLFKETFSDLNQFWRESSSVDNSSEIISKIDTTNYTTYSHPMQTESGEILLLKSDYDKPSRFVLFDVDNSSEHRVAYTGNLSTRPAYAAGRVWWTEYRRSPLFAQSVNSQLCYMDLLERVPRRVKGAKSALYPTPIGASRNHIAYVEYSIEGRYSVVELKEGKEVNRVALDDWREIHSLAWDNTTNSLYTLVTGESGMWIEKFDGKAFEPITKAAFVTLSNLKAKDGVLYFGSIASGKDEAHSLNLATGVESQITTSRYGSFQPNAIDGDIYMTTYDKFGYHLARQSTKAKAKSVEWSLTPRNVVNPERKSWGVVNLDTVRFERSAVEDYSVKRYRKSTHLVNFHSWAPFRFNPHSILSEKGLDIGLGATLVSQNLLASSDGYISYGWDHYEGSVLRGGMTYNGLGVQLDLSATYGGDQLSYLVVYNNLGVYRDISLSATLPLIFQRGYHTTTLTPSVGWSYSNGVLPFGLHSAYDAQNGHTVLYDRVVSGLNKLSFGLNFSDYVRSAYRDVATPFGVVASAGYSLDPYNRDFAHLLALYAKVYTPGFFENNSLSVATAYQNTFGGFAINDISVLSYKSSLLVPRGYSYLEVGNNNYVAASVDYQFPLCYPEFGIPSILYLKRLRLNIGADLAQYNITRSRQEQLYSYGADLIVDFNAISMAAASTATVKFSLYKPKNRNLYFQFSLGLPF